MLVSPRCLGFIQCKYDIMRIESSNSLAVVVNDDPVQLKLLSGLLSMSGLEVISFTGAEAAMAAMDQERPPAIIITDLYMPGIDGWQFCRLLRSPEYACFNHVPIIVVSATYAGDEPDRIAADLGVEAFISAPVEGIEFIKHVKAILCGRKKHVFLSLLIVEDSSSLACHLQQAFISRGYRADKAFTVNEAVHAFSTNHYDMAIIDYHLPDGQGDSLLDNFMEKRPDCICLMMTTDPSAELALDWMKRGAAAYLRKPFEVEYLLEICDRARRERTLLRAQDLLEKRTKELCASEKKYVSLLESLPIGVFRNTPGPYGQFVMANASLARMHGYDTLEEFMTQDVQSIYADKSHMYQLFEELKQNNNVQDMEVMLKRKDRSTFYGSITARALSDKHGKIIFIDGFLTNITEKKQAEDERQKLQDQLLQARKMESVGMLAGGVAHDFNNLLQAISGNAQLLQKNKAGDHPDRKYLRAIDRSIYSASQLIRRLLLFSRKEVTDKRMVDLNREISETSDVLERTFPRMIGIKLALDQNIRPVYADPVQVEQMLLNLGSNAFDSMPEGGRLSIETENVLLDSENQAGLEPGKYVLVKVSDTGCGMDSKTMENIYDPFFTTKETGKGTGLGLATVYGIIKKHGGHIQCYSEPGSGTIFMLYFPAMEQGEVEIPEQQTEIIPCGGNETILVVDDEPAITELTREGLEDYGYRVITAEDGKQAINTYQEHGRNIDLVLLDLNMPGIGGYKCLHKLLDIDSSVKVIISSGYMVNKHAQDSLLSGARSIISKPYQLKKLAETVRNVLDIDS